MTNDNNDRPFYLIGLGDHRRGVLVGDRPTELPGPPATSVPLRGMAVPVRVHRWDEEQCPHAVLHHARMGVPQEAS